ncbi:MAG TPA: DPP IV N-terminal domain-containing protein [Gemmatimonadaceae bacterium]|nr:DPP IV N-terminal domain-containing protein [Gemmatimonadaceae bacterium]
MRLARWWIAALSCAATIAPAIVHAQGTAADYARAEGYRERTAGLIVDDPDTPVWLSKGDRFWYRKSVVGGHVFVMVDADSRKKEPAFDHERLAASLSRVMHDTITATTLPFRGFSLVDDDRAIEFALGAGPGSGRPVVTRERWRCTITDYVCERAAVVRDTSWRAQRNWGGGLFGDPREAPNRPQRSPDGKWEALIRNYNVYVRPFGEDEGVMLSTDGSEGDAYDAASISWSPDSRHIAAYRVRPGYQREVHYVESSPEDQLQPKYSTLLYSKPGDVLDVERPVVFDVTARKQIAVDSTLFPNAYSMSALVWHEDGRSLTFEYNQRGHQAYRVIEVDAATGKARAVIDEESPTFFEYSGKLYRYDIADGKEIIWMSERDGWNHLYLYDGASGKVKNQITKGNWVVRGVDWVDTTKRQVWFHASGMYQGKDPYFVHYYRINFDGSGLTTFTDADAMHEVAYSPDHKYYVDLYSRVDLPPVMELRRTSDQSKIMDLEHADASRLLATGWRPPEVFTAKGRDGKTDIWGVIIRPTNFDPKKKYPVIENIYAGPQGSFVPKTFGVQAGMQAQAELGFIVVQIDGMGTSNRSKAFHDVAWKNLADAGFPDRILWHKAVAAKYPYYDISRVGIYGTSAGGQNSMGALLFHPEFYDVAVSAAGCHDNRMDKIWWNEQWMGWPIGPQYAASSNVDNAYRLQGKVLLVVGEMDKNVDPSSTMQLVNALIKADKQFDLLVVPGMGHGSGGAYGEVKRFDFFVHNLLGVEPPNRNAMTAPGTKSAEGQR